MGISLINLWLSEFSNKKNGMCGLCGQTGRINTVGKTFTPAGVECGIEAFCICPNGRAIKRAINRMKIFGAK